MTGPAPVRELRGHLSRAARAGHPYVATLVLPDRFDADRDAEVDGLAETGLLFDAQTATLSGLPMRPGSFELRVHGHWNMTRAVVIVDLPVTPDPFSLWQDIPSDADAPFAKPDIDHAAMTGDLTLLMASRRGRKHANTGAFRDDDAGLAHDAATGWHIGVVADGAGSAALSREGARLAVRAVLAALPGALTDVTREAIGAAMVGAAQAAVTAIARLASETGENADVFATTLLIGAARRTDTGWLCASFSIGDGLMALWDADAGVVTPMIAADSGEFAGQTRFLRADILASAAACTARSFITETSGFTAFCLMTDGVSDAQFPTMATESDAAHWRDFWFGEIAPALDAPDPAAALADWLNFRVPGEHDDRSIVLMLPRAVP